MLRIFDVIRLHVRSLWQRARLEFELDRELRAHIACQEEESFAKQPGT
jgi:hypothetical protein